MSQIALITDLHFGARENNITFDEFFEKFYTNTFFPYLLEHNIKTVVILGDTFDKRKNINFLILDNCKRYFFNQLQQHDISVYMIVGNHDAHFKNTISVNSPRLLLGEFDNITIIDHPSEIYIGSRDILMMPWICEENSKASMDLLQSTKATVCMGHFEISGFSMYKGVESHGGLDPNVFRKFECTFSGHYHTRSKKGKIQYLGNPYEIVWSDYDDPRGFHIFDTDTLELEFIQNPYTMFSKIEYKDGMKVDDLDISDKIIKIVLNESVDDKKFNKFVQSINDNSPSEVKIKDNYLFEYSDEDLNIDDEENHKDTLSMIKNYIDTVDYELSKTRLKSTMSRLYNTAILDTEEC